MRWAGADETFLDRPDTTAVGRLMLGRYGGRIDAGAHKNEDAALLLDGSDWELAVVADAHAGGDSSALVVELLESSSELQRVLGRPSPMALSALHAGVVERLLAADTSQLTGETAVLVVARKGGFVSWLSVGDCVAYALHPDLARLGQHALNQRSFYEWFGRADSLRLGVPCYASGVHALRPGRTRIVLVTDGLLELGDKRYSDGARLHADFYDGDLGEGVRQLMQAVHEGRGGDSATVVAWDVTGGDRPIQPSR
jgi:serine/threonine protein phosphatase PrpC